VRRLVTAPRVFAFIRSTNAGKTYDVSADVVSGSVSRRVNDVSTASLVLRNPKRKYTRTKTPQNPNGKNVPLFLPMDLITIWMQRISGIPIQVFTGYLDTSPYFALYPQNCNVTASCTLKRLKYSYFDPGLQFFMDWIHDAGKGQWTQLNNFGNFTNIDQQTGAYSYSEDTDGDGITDKVNDGGFGELLLRFMTDIAGWPTNQVVIGQLDPGIAPKAAKMFMKLNDAAGADYNQLVVWLAQGMGITVPEVRSDGIRADGSLPPIEGRIVANIKNAAGDGAGGIEALPLVAAAWHLSGWKPDKMSSSSVIGPVQPKDVRYGLYQIKEGTYFGKKWTKANLTDHIFTNTQLFGKLLGRQLIDSQRAADAVNAGTNAVTGSTPAQNASALRARLNEGNAKVLAEAVNGVLGYEAMTEVQADTALSRAKNNLAALTSPGAAANSEVKVIKTREIEWSDEELESLLDDQEMKVKGQYEKAKSLIEACQIIYCVKKMFGENLKLSRFDDQQSDSVYFVAKNNSTLVDVGPKIALDGHEHDQASKQAVDLIKTFLTVKEVPSVTLFTYSPTGIRISARLENGARRGTASGAASNAGSSSECVRFRVEKGMKLPVQMAPLIEESAVSTEGIDAKNSNTISATWENVAQVGTNAAFLASVTFPYDRIESTNLKGERSLMNDISCFEAVQQMSAASMRCFMSMPDGRFMAFYPDYFGARRGPYWPIYDIEIEDFQIQLNDHNLVTHSFVTGDTQPGPDGVDWMDRIASRGVASITMTEILDSFINDSYLNTEATAPTGPKGAKKLLDAEAFLKRFGARPRKEENPIIRNTAFEFLFAFQKFMEYWAAQFATEVQFTFQPEVMAGGIIWLPQHGLQFFVESVDHTFDYESGFTTQPVLTSPAIANKPGIRDRFADLYPGMALATTSSVGASGGGG